MSDNLHQTLDYILLVAGGTTGFYVEVNHLDAILSVTLHAVSIISLLAYCIINFTKAYTKIRMKVIIFKYKIRSFFKK